MIKIKLGVEVAKDIEANKPLHDQVWNKQGRITFTDSFIYVGKGDTGKVKYTPVSGIDTLIALVDKLEEAITSTSSVPSGALQVSSGEYLLTQSGKYIETTEN